jgi:tellurite resistance-related uncharacterized protein
MIKAGRRKIRCEIHNLINSIWNKEVLPEEWKASIIAPIYKMEWKKILVIKGHNAFVKYIHSFIQNPASKLTLYAEEITGEDQCEFRHNRSTTDHIFRIRLTLENKIVLQF